MTPITACRTMYYHYNDLCELCSRFLNVTNVPPVIEGPRSESNNSKCKMRKFHLHIIITCYIVGITPKF